MIPKTFQIDFIRAIIDYKLSENDNETYFDNDDYNGIANFSYYEHLASDGAVERYVKKYQELTQQQNRTHLVGLGVLTTSDNPTITNLYQSFISPFEFNYIVRCKLADRDKMLGTLYHLIDELKGRKIDVAQLDSGVLFPVGTIKDTLKVGDFVGEITNSVSISDLLTSIASLGITIPTWEENDYLYAEYDGKLVRYEYLSSVWTQNTTFFDSETSEYYHHSFEKYKVSMSFSDISVGQPFTLDANEYISFELGGSATLVSNGVRLGNDLVRVYIRKNKIIVSDTNANNIYFQTLANNESIVYADTELEPLEIPSNTNANTITNQLRSNFFLSNSHTDSVANTIQYTFICDFSTPSQGANLIKQWFNYSRYHNCNLDNSNNIQYNSITPNIIYTITEMWSSWGEIDKVSFDAKLFDDIGVENTESDTLTLNLSFQLQGDNY